MQVSGEQSLNGVTLEILDPLAETGWDDEMRRFPEATVFHSSAWARAIVDAYGYRPRYLRATYDNGIVVWLPLMEVSSGLTGTRGVSLPFSDYCFPLANGGPLSDEELRWLVDAFANLHWRYFEIKGVDGISEEIPASRRYMIHTVSLDQTEGELKSSLRGSTRRNIALASRSNVRVDSSQDWTALKEFYRLNCLSRRDHGLPPQPLRFFRSLHRHVIQSGLGFTTLAYLDGQAIAGDVFLHFGRNAVQKFGAADRRFGSSRAPYLVMWEAITAYRQRGFASLSLGRTQLENTGLIQFKNGWGADQRFISYYNYSYRGQRFTTETSDFEPWYAPIVRKLPIPVLRLAGSALYRHIG